MAKKQDVAAWLQAVVDAVRRGEKPEETAAKVETLIAWTACAIWIENLFPGRLVGDVVVTKFVVKEDKRDERKACLTVTGVRRKEKLITFHSGPMGAGLFQSFRARAAEDRIKWKPDTPWESNGGEDETIPLPALGDV